MPNFNRVILAGNITRDPELRTTQGGTAIVEFGLAINRYRKDQPDEAHFFDCTAWGARGEAIASHLGKGDPILVEGRLTQSRWTDKETQKPRSRVTVTVENFQFVGSRKASGQPAQPAPSDHAAPHGNYQVDDDVSF